MIVPMITNSPRPASARTSRTRAAAALSAAAILVLTGCGDDDDPLAGNENPGPGAAAPVIPAAATERSEAGGVAFVTYYFETLVNEANSTGEFEPLVTASHPQCVVCRATVGDVAAAYVRGSIDGGQVSVDDVTAAGDSEAVNNVRLKYSTEVSRVLDADGDELYTVPARNGVDFFVQVQWDADSSGWRMRQIVNQRLLDQQNGQNAQDGDDGDDADPSATPDPDATADPDSDDADDADAEATVDPDVSIEPDVVE